MVLFICKKNSGYGAAYNGRRSGLFNSTRFIAEGLTDAGVPAEVIEVNDNNDIDRAVTQRRPSLVIIEALWVVPEKFDVLKRRHPKVRWAVHLHSNAPFLALEGVAVKWCRGYERRGITIIVNSPQALEAVRVFVPEAVLLLNAYRGNFEHPHGKPIDDTVRVGCFGAIRPMKNQLAQALAAIQFAHEEDSDLEFFINATRSEGGDPVLTNIRDLFKGRPFDDLVEVPWLPHDRFLDLLATMDICLQVSLSETFNIVTADCVAMGLPVITSSEVAWVDAECHAPTDSVDTIARRMAGVFGHKRLVLNNQRRLQRASAEAIREWARFAA